MRNELFPELIARWADGIDWGAYRIVGFTSTFEQNVSSLALARRIKEKWPEVVIVFGGANYDGEMGPEYVRAFPWIDYAVVGEGDQALPALVARVARNESALDVPGVAGRREDGAVKNGSAPNIRDLDALPDPDYDELLRCAHAPRPAGGAGRVAPAPPLRERPRAAGGERSTTAPSAG